MEENKEVIKVFWYAMAHRRYEQGQFIGVDMNFVVKVMEIFGVKNRRQCLEGVVKLINHSLDKKVKR